jgi:Na+-driven multidrug efflux pump
MPIVGLMMAGAIIFQAIGKVIHSVVTSLARSVLFLLPLILILPQFWQMDGVWLAFPLSDILTTILTVGLLIPILLDFKRKSLMHYYDEPGRPSEMLQQPEETLVKR